MTEGERRRGRRSLTALSQELSGHVKKLNEENGRGGIEAVVRRLRQHPRFENINRATVHRWLATKSNDASIEDEESHYILRRRIGQALDVLNMAPKESPKELKIAAPFNLSALPIFVIAAPEYISHHQRWLDKIRSEIKPPSPPSFQLEEFDTGVEALKHLRNIDLDHNVAIAAKEFWNAQEGDELLCDIFDLQLCGISMIDFQSRAEAKWPRTVGYPKDSAVMKPIERRWRRGKPEVWKPYSASDIEGIAQDLANEKIQAFVAWDPIVNKVRKDLLNILTRQRRKIFDLHTNICGTLSMSIYTNRLKPPPRVGLIEFLSVVNKTAEALRTKISREAHKEESLFARAVAECFNQDLSNVAEDSFSFRLIPQTVIQLWMQDAVKK